MCESNVNILNIFKPDDIIPSPEQKQSLFEDLADNIHEERKVNNLNLDQKHYIYTRIRKQGQSFTKIWRKASLFFSTIKNIEIWKQY